MASIVKKYPRPKQMRGLVASHYKFNVPLGLAISACAGYLWWRLTGVKTKKLYKEFYMNYDADRDYIRMREAGVFDSIPKQGHYRMDINE